jgi:hypothetical protein
VIAAVWAAIGRIALKVLKALAGNEKGRKFLLYVICIALVIVLLPLIAAIALFGSLSGGADIDYNTVYDNLPVEYREMMEEYETELDKIAEVFEDNSLSKSDISKAKTLYLSCFAGKSLDEDFYQDYADCFYYASDSNELLDNLSSTFGVTFTEREREQFENLYS